MSPKSNPLSNHAKSNLATSLALFFEVKYHEETVGRVPMFVAAPNHYEAFAHHCQLVLYALNAQGTKKIMNTNQKELACKGVGTYSISITLAPEAYTLLPGVNDSEEAWHNLSNFSTISFATACTVNILF